ncbi:MAG TPA: glutamyl-tRNA reductase [Prolixibacteraceae bacterium]|jgi:glutamyl-tRNA reductase|nr:glutamyl-tRNA reductase [Prolixibacteraceae bacterium]
MIGLIGISYKTAPLEVRENFSFSKEEIVPFSEMLQQETEISDLVLISTCNRTEIYFSQDIHDNQTAFELVYEVIKKFKNVNDHCWHYFYHRSNAGAVRHLFEVSSGLDSLIIGEDQIIGQVKEAYLRCTEAALTDAVLMRLFQKSFEAGKRVRSETGIKLGITSVSSAAVEMCACLLNGVSDKSVLLVGAGETGNLALQNIVKKGVQKVTITNRTAEKAERTASKYNAETVPFEDFEDHLYESDIVMIATSAVKPLITKEMVVQSLKLRNNQPQVYIDLSVPRNIEKEVAELEHINVLGVDDLQKIVEQTTEKKKESAAKAEIIIDEVVADYSEWLASRSLRPAINTITTNLQAINIEELSTYRKLSTPEMQEIVDDYAKHLTQRYTRLLIKNLKDLTDNGKNIDSLKTINDLFKFV